MPSSYEHDPIVELSHWSVYEVPLYGVDAPWTRHFVGFAEELGLAQVSSAILMFDRSTGVGASASRRVFQLLGGCGQRHDSAQLWARWKSLNDIRLERDVTPGYFNANVASVGRVATEQCVS